jgi:uncharacterized protein
MNYHIIGLIFLVIGSAGYGEEAAQEIMNRVQKTVLPDFFSSKMSLLVEKGQRKHTIGLTLKSGVFGNVRKTIMVCHTPKDIEGSAFLVHLPKNKEGSKWFYLPIIGSVKKVSSSQQDMKLMGTDLRFWDIAPPNSGAFEYKILKDAKTEGEAYWRIEAKPKTIAISDKYGIVQALFEIDQASYLLKRSIIQLAENRKRLMQVKEVAQIRGLNLSKRVVYTMKRNGKVISKTILTQSEIKVGEKLREDAFNPKTLDSHSHH